jgi:autotransporter-associated beta strand protein
MALTSSPVSSVSASQALGSTAAAKNTGAESQDRFLKLLVAQLNNQDPMNPMDNAQMTTQMAQINTVTGDVQIGGLADAPVSLTMTNSTLNATGWLSLGHETGTANSTTTLTRAAVTAGNLRLGYATVANSGSHAMSLANSTVAVTGETLIGNIGPSVGTLSVQGTSSFRTGSDMNVGNSAGTQGSVTVGGSATLAVLGRLRVGDLGIGSVAATGSTRLTLNQVQIGNNVGATGTMTMDTDSAATLTGYLAVGNAGAGVLAMSGRSRMDVQYDLNVADLGGASGTIFMTQATNQQQTIASRLELYDGVTVTTNSPTAPLVISGTVIGPGRLEKTGPGVLVLSASNTFRGGLQSLSGGSVGDLGTIRLTHSAAAGAGTVALPASNASSIVVELQNGIDVPNDLTTAGRSSFTFLRNASGSNAWLGDITITGLGGGYAIDEGGIHHVTLQSPLNFENCFGYIDAYADRLELVGCGEQGIPSRTMRFATAGSVSH